MVAVASPRNSGLVACSDQLPVSLLLERPLEQGKRGRFVATLTLRSLVLLPGHELRPREQRPLPLGVHRVHDALGGHRDRDRRGLRRGLEFTTAIYAPSWRVVIDHYKYLRINDSKVT